MCASDAASRAARPRLEDVVVVEGLHDRHKVESAVDADVFVVGGDRISRRLLQQLQRIRRTRGIIILTDPDGPGERIRRRIDEQVPGCRHAFIPRAAATDGRRVGVELASVEAIVEALLHTRGAAASAAAPTARAPVFSLADLVVVGLAGCAGAAERRRQVGERLGIGSANAKAFVRKLNLLGVTRAEWEAALAGLVGDGAPAAAWETSLSADTRGDGAGG
ncbi:ribonuclease M5 [Alicyclobacillus shizuokensis]|uniref:ribonuclease M5 n=1 Tax=Alicyclobacillus shizuokensis TaxID=392014 RepID=UPI0009FAD298|nr:ribonuclease M5 [Alicyclobacillus shizuokensis]MCL6626436.1 ribonuclease M5 [Alicyclobacillus shizuokensis]